MPMTPMQYIVGVNCDVCKKPATHYYGGVALCCQCHGGEIIDENETYEIHANWPIDPHYVHLEFILG